MVLRGARKLVISSRSGIQTGYQQQRIHIWTSYGVEVKISMKNVTTERGCEDLINEATELGPIDAIPKLRFTCNFKGAIGDVGLAAKMQKENKELAFGGIVQQKISSCLEVLDVLLNHTYPVLSSTKDNILSAVETVAYVLGIKAAP
ncbi:hypothetical protein Zmor_018628 [Zophobas morio]|uniref:Ketoreductase (KR) domain-containing protein n=1 Tax=Zophobas morio TaxID=2755281 RepID=A0AA38MD91_9CUCU|nr:hypothetical protein Zmor_018628 [Zophobas morio]